MPRTPDIFGSSIVAVGAFNPAIFSPDWLNRHGLIGAGDVEAAANSETLVVSRRVAAMETDWFALQVLENQMSLASKGVLTPAIKDLAQGILLLLPHIPISALGLNFHAHYQMSTESEQHRVGDVLAPKSVWAELFDAQQYCFGVAELQMKIQHGSRDSRAERDDEIRVHIQPSSKVKAGVYFLFNDHRADFVKVGDGRPTAERAATIVGSEWESTWARAADTFEQLLNKTLAEDSGQ